MTTIDRQFMRDLRVSLELALSVVAERHGISIKVGHGTFAGENGAFKLELATIGGDGIANTKERSDFKRYAAMLNLKPEWLDQEFEQGGDTFTIRGLRLKARKRPVIASKKGGKLFVFAASDIAIRMHGK